MIRRHFLKQGTLAGLAISASSIAAASINDTAKTTQAEGEPDDFSLNEVTIDALQQKMKSGKYTSVAITKLYVSRIEAIDKKGPAINAVIEVNPDALTIAGNMDNERKAGKVRGPLHGIPV